MSREFDISVRVFAPDDATLLAARKAVEEIFGYTSPPDATGWQERGAYSCEMSTRIGDVISVRGLTRGVSEAAPTAYILSEWGLFDDSVGYFLLHNGEVVASERSEYRFTDDGGDGVMTVVERNGVSFDSGLSEDAPRADIYVISRNQKHEIDPMPDKVPCWKCKKNWAKLYEKRQRETAMAWQLATGKLCYDQRGWGRRRFDKVCIACSLDPEAVLRNDPDLKDEPISPEELAKTAKARVLPF